MYLKGLIIQNYRKFGTRNNKIEFVDAKSYREQNEKQDLNIAPTTTLIVGKNNSGKTSVTEALEKLINNKTFNANDFNFSYLKRLLNEYLKNVKEKTEIVKTPLIEFKIIIGLDDESHDLITNLVNFMTLENAEKSEFEIFIKYELKDNEIFINGIGELLEKNLEIDRSLLFRKFLEYVDNSDFKINYYNASGDAVKFNISDLVELASIRANKIDGNKSLSSAFSKIIEYRYKSLLDASDKKELEDKISEINEDLTSNISKKHTQNINESLGKIESQEKLQVLLSSDLTFKKLMINLIRYEYVEREHTIPEGQFGLGYTNLMMIIANLIDYIEKYPEQSFNSKVNLISIEEPEAFMHPQMQELFIKYINDAITSILMSKTKKVNSQLIITTHSSHILNSKIHCGNTFNNINYMTTVNKRSEVVTLSDEKVIPDSDNKADDLKFLKKHIKYKVSELFFSDAIIFVEGITEETLIRYYIDNNLKLNKYYISIFNIDGAHGLVYSELIKLLKIPALIITDLDIYRKEEEKEKFLQVTDITDRVTTNKTIIKFNNNTNKLIELNDFFEKDNMYIAYQGKIAGYYATSFEEALILSNYSNELLNSVLKKTKPNIYEEIVGKDGEQDKTKLKDNSYKLQKKLSNSKSDFANNLLYELITKQGDFKIPELSDYIADGLGWLLEKLEMENK